jgi:hypothetical protein
MAEKNSHSADFYSSHREGEQEPLVEDREADNCLVDEEEEPVQRVTSLPGGAKRDGYFKQRDYQ